MFQVVTSRSDVLDMVVVIADLIVPVQQVEDAERSWRNPGRGELETIAVVIDFRDQVPQRCDLVDRIVTRPFGPGVVALVESGRSDLVFDLAQRGVLKCLPVPPVYEELKQALRYVVSMTTVSGRIKDGSQVVREGTPVAGLSPIDVETIMAPLKGPSAAARSLRRKVLRAAAGDTSIVLAGESGVGKQVVATIIHALSPRRNESFVDVNVCGIAESIFESELFGAVPGAFTGAVRHRGFFARAHGGTLFLDEIGEMPASLQPKILKAVEDGMFYPLGSDELRQVDVRVISATNRPLYSLVKAGGFRRDLWNRIATVTITIPPLSERLEDIPHIARQILHRDGRDDVVLKPDAIRALQHHRWTGNVRELKAVLERSLQSRTRPVLHARNLCFDPEMEDDEQDVLDELF